MFPHEKQTLHRITKKLREKFHSKIISIYAFGSRVRGEQTAWSDFDILIIVNHKTPELENQIINIFVEEEIKSNLSFSPLIKDVTAFKMEKKLNNPFYENIIKEGILL